MSLTDLVYDVIKDEKWFKTLSMDEQGEICVELAKGMGDVKEALKIACDNPRLHYEATKNGGYCPRCRERLDEIV